MEHVQHSQAGEYVGNYANVDGMLWDISSKLARAQIARQISNNSAFRRQQHSRIHKPLSTGNSPQAMSRRRMGAHQRLTPHQSEMHPQLSRRRAITAATNNPAAELRPATWHPQLMPGQVNSCHRHTMYEPSQHTMPLQQPITPAATSPASQPDYNHGHRDRYYSVPGQPFFDAAYMHVPISSDWATDMSPAQPSMGTPASAVPSISQGDHFLSGVQPVSRSFVPLTPSSYMQPRYPHSAPITPDAQQRVIAKPLDVQQQPEEEDEGPELIGMGLYDRPEQPGLLLGGGWNIGSPAQSGRGLKLADAWTPPEEDEEESDDGDGDEEDEDSEQHEDDMDVELDEQAVPDVYGSGNHLPQFDLSNKSFFFADDPDASLGATTLAGLTMADWNGAAQTWVS